MGPFARLIPSRGLRVAVALGSAVLVGTAAFLLGRHEDVAPNAATPAFLQHQLGQPGPVAGGAAGTSTAVQTLRASHEAAVALAPAGLKVSSGKHSVGLGSMDAGGAGWTVFQHGGSRATSFGHEAVTVSPTEVEEYLIVDSHQGTRTWSWQLDAAGLTPRLGAGGTVGFLAGHRLLDTYIKPVAIMDARGADITPAGARWSLARRGAGWTLQLRLDDAALPTPYTIDPGIVLHGTPAASDNGTSATTTLDLAVPAGIVVNDFLVAQVAVRGGTGTTITPPAGWTLIRRDNATTNLAQAIYYHVASGSEPATYTWTITSNRAAGGMVAYQGVDASSPIDAQSGANDTTNTSSAVAAAAVTTTVANDMLVGFFSIRSNSTFTPPAGMTEEYDGTGGSGSGPAAEAADLRQAAIGSSGTETANATAVGYWVAQLIALKPDVTAPTNVLTTSSTSPAGSAYVSGTTLYYRGTGGGSGGSFQLTDTVADAGSGPASASFPALGGTTTGWTHATQTVSTPAGGPFATSNAFSWSEGTTSAPTVAVTSTDVAGNTSATTTLTFADDSSNPTGSLTAPASGATVSGAAVTVSSNSADGGSGVGSVAFQRSPAGAGTWTTIGTDTTSPYSVAWDTTVMATGLYDLRAVTTDNVGNNFTSALATNVNVPDVTAPTNALSLASVSPSGSAFLSGTTVYYRGTGGGSGGNFQLTNTMSDAGSGPASSSFPALGGTTTGWTHTAQTRSTPSGGPYTTTNAYTWSEGASSAPTEAVQGTDVSGNTATTTLTFTNDSTNPTGSVTAPAAAAAVSGAAVTVSSNSADAGSGLASVAFQRSPAGAGSWTTIGTDTTSPYSVAWDTTGLAEGNYDLRAVTTDNVGNSFTSATIANIVVDNTAPTGSLTAPASSATLVGTVTVSANSADARSGVASATFQRSTAGANVWTTIATDSTSPYSASWNTAAGSDGLFDLRVVTTDNAGNVTNSASVTNVRVDNTNPSNSVTVVSASPSTAVSKTGNTVYYRGTGGGSGGSFQLRNSVNDSGSGPASATFPALGGTTTGWSHSGETISTPSGGPYTSTSAYTWTEGTTSAPTEALTSVDNAGNGSSTTTLTFTDDSTNPTGSITAPAASAAVRSFVTVSSDSADTGSGVDHVDFQYSVSGANSWSAIGTDTSSPFSASWWSFLISDGLYDLRAITTDNVGNTFTSATITVRVDNTNPTGSLTAPSANTSVHGASVTVSSNSADSGSGVATATFQRSAAGANSWTTIGTAVASPYSVTFDTTAVADGLYDLRVVTADNAGNSVNSATVANVRVDNTGSANALSLSSVSPAGSAVLSGTTVFYRGSGGGSGGSFQVTNAVTDAGSGPASSTFPALGGTATGWTHTNQTISTPAGGPYVSTSAFAWSEGTSSSPTEAVSSVDNVGNAATTTTLTFTNDSTSPTGSLTAPAASAVVSGAAVAVSSNSADAGAGVTSAVFQRSAAGANSWTTIATDTTSPYSVSWDTTAVADGLYDLRVVTTDNVGNTFTSALVTNVRVDNTAPTIAVAVASVSPSGSAYKSGSTVYYRGTGGGSGGSFQVQTTVTDAGSGAASATFPALGGTTTGWTHTNQTISTPAGGPYVSTSAFAWSEGASSSPTEALTGTDTGGLSSAATTLTFTNDSTSPTGSLTAPAASANVRGSAVTVSSNSADAGAGVTSAAFQRSSAGANSWTTIATDTTSPYSASWDTTAVADGLYDLRVVTTDNVGNTFTSALVTNVRVDNTGSANALSLSSVSPAGSAVLSGTTVFYRGSGGGSGGSFQVTNAVTDAGSGPASSTFPALGGTATGWTHTNQTISTPAGGPYVSTSAFAWSEGTSSSPTEAVSSVDNVGNAATTTTLTFTNDSTSPTGSLTAPAASAVVSGAAVAVSSNSADAGAGVTSAVFQRSAAGANSWTTIATDTTSPYSVSWDTTAVADGLYDLRAITTDNVGNTFTSALVTNVRVDNTAPTIAVAVASVSPSGSAYKSGSTVYYRGTGGGSGGSFQVQTTVTDAGSGAASATFPALGGTTTGWTHTNQTISTPAGGPYVSTSAFAWSEGASSSPTEALTGTDTGGLSSAATTLTFTNDSTSPTGSLTAPAASANVRGSAVTVSSNSADAGAGVTSAAFQRSSAGANSWTTIATDTTSPYSASWDTTAVADGLYDLRVVTTDNVGNTFTSALVTNVQVDNTAPTGSVTAPAAGASVGGSAVPVTANSADGGSGVASAAFQRSPAGAGSWTTIGTDASAPYALTWDTSAVAEGSYDLRVITTDAAGNQTTSATVAGVVVDNTAPAVPGAPSATTPTNAAPALTWSAVAGAASYEVYRGGALIGTSGSASYTDGSLTGDGSYAYAVDAVDAAGNRSAAGATFTVVYDTTAPGIPATPGTAATVTSGQPSVYWTAVSGSPTGYRIFRDNVLVTTVATAPSSGSPWTDTGIPADGSYAYAVSALDAAGNESARSTARTITVDTTAPPAPAITAAASPVSGSPAITWSLVTDERTGIASYQVYRDGTLIATTSNATTSATDSGASEASHTYTLKAVDGAGNLSAAATATIVVDRTAPQAPAFLSGASPTRSAPALTWASVLDAASYVVQRDGADIAQTAGTSLTDAGVTVEGTYVYTVRAVDAAGNVSTTSPTASVTYDVTPPAVPTGLAGPALTNAAPHLTWTAVSGAAAYGLYRDGASLGTVGVASFDDTTLTAEGAHAYAVTSLDAAGNESAASASVTVTFDQTPPAVPSGLAVPSLTNAAPALTWSASSGAASYRVYRGGALVGQTGSTSYTDQTVPGDGTYAYAVSAVDAAGNESSHSSPQSVVVDQTPPNPPAGLTGQTPTTAVPVLSWTAAAGAVSYTVRRDGTTAETVTTTGFTDSAVADLLASADPGIYPYVYTVTATDAAGNESAASSDFTVSVDTAASQGPTLLDGATPTNAKPHLHWHAVAGAQSYVLYRDGVQVGTPASASFTDTALTVDGAYTYTVTAIDGVGVESQASSPHTVVYDTTPPDAPAGLTGTSPTNADPVLSWQTTADAVVYRLYRDGALVTETSSTTAGDPSPGADGTYHYTVTAVDATGNESAPSASRSVQLLTVPPDAPTGLAATSPTRVAPALTWTASAGTDHYVVYRDGIAAGTPAAAAFTDAAGLPDGSYTYRVAAVDAAGNESDLSAARAVVLDTVAPAAPSAPTVPPVVNTGPTVTWTGPGDAAHYIVYRDGAAVAAPSAAVYADTGLTGEGDHDYAVAAVDAAGNTSSVSSVTTTTLDTVPPAVPADLAAASPTPSAPLLTWAPVSDAVSYRVYRDGAQVGAPAGATFTDSGLPADGSYRYAVAAVDVAGNVSALTLPVDVVYDTTAPSAPAGLAAATPTTGYPSLTWSTTTDAVQYTVYRDGSAIATTAGTAYVDHGAPATHQYAYTVTAVDAAGNEGAASAVATVQVNLPPSGVPGNLDAVSPTRTAPELSWGSVAGSNVVYRVYRDGSFVATTSTTGYTDAAPGGDGTYTYTVTATAAGSLESDASNAVTVVFDTTAPASPAAPTGMAITNLHPALDWTAVPTATAYGVYRDRARIATVPDLSYTDATVGEGTYGYTITAIDLAGNESVPSSAMTVVYDATAPGVPDGLAGPSPTQTVSVTWNAVSDAALYRVYRNGVLVDSPTGTELTATGVPGDGAYAFRVAAVDAAGNESGLSQSLSVVVDTVAPDAPVVVAAASPTNADPSLSWDPVLGASGYTVDRDGSPLATTSATSFTEPVADGSYVYTVVAADAAGNHSAPSEPATVLVDTTAPAPPTGLAASSATRVAPVLTWEASSGATQYRAFLDGTPEGITADTTFTFALPADGDHHLAVSAIDAAGNESAPSSAITVTVDHTPPATPDGLAGTSPTGVAPAIHWDAVPGADHYDVTRDGAAVGSVGVAAFTDSIPDSDATLSYTVEAVDLAGNRSAASAPLDIAFDATPPATPSGLAAAGSPTSTPPSLHWQPVGDATAYRLYRDGTLAGETSTTQLDDPGATAEGDHDYRVTAVDAAGNESAASGAVTVTVDLTAPDAPAGLAATSPTRVTPSLTWDAVAGAAGYRVYRDGARVAETDGTASTDADVSTDGSYAYTVTAIDAAGNESPASAPLTVVLDTVAPDAPDAPSAASPTANDPALTWPAVPGATSYGIYRDGALVDSSALPLYTDAAATADGPHAYAVSATDAAGNESARSATTTVVVKRSPAGVPGGLAAASPTRDAPVVTWDAVGDAVFLPGLPRRRTRRVADRPDLHRCRRGRGHPLLRRGRRRHRRPRLEPVRGGHGRARPDAARRPGRDRDPAHQRRSRARVRHRRRRRRLPRHARRPRRLRRRGDRVRGRLAARRQLSLRGASSRPGRERVRCRRRHHRRRHRSPGRSQRTDGCDPGRGRPGADLVGSRRRRLVRDLPRRRGHLPQRHRRRDRYHAPRRRRLPVPHRRRRRRGQHVRGGRSVLDRGRSHAAGSPLGADRQPEPDQHPAEPLLAGRRRRGVLRRRPRRRCGRHDHSDDLARRPGHHLRLLRGTCRRRRRQHLRRLGARRRRRRHHRPGRSDRAPGVLAGAGRRPLVAAGRRRRPVHRRPRRQRRRQRHRHDVHGESRRGLPRLRRPQRRRRGERVVACHRHGRRRPHAASYSHRPRGPGPRAGARRLVARRAGRDRLPHLRRRRPPGRARRHDLHRHGRRARRRLARDHRVRARRRAQRVCALRPGRHRDRHDRARCAGLVRGTVADAPRPGPDLGLRRRCGALRADPRWHRAGAADRRGVHRFGGERGLAHLSRDGRRRRRQRFAPGRGLGRVPRPAPCARPVGRLALDGRTAEPDGRRRPVVSRRGQRRCCLRQRLGFVRSGQLDARGRARRRGRPDPLDDGVRRLGVRCHLHGSHRRRAGRPHVPGAARRFVRIGLGLVGGGAGDGPGRAGCTRGRRRRADEPGTCTCRGRP